MFANTNITIPFKERKINFSKPVRIYRNLTKKGVWYSIIQSSLTVAHTSSVCLKDCTFNVNEKTRQWVIKNKRKTFHAYIEGYIIDSGCGTTSNKNDLPAIIKYDPHKNNGFTCDNLTIEPFIVKGARFVICNEEGVKAAYLIK